MTLKWSQSRILLLELLLLSSSPSSSIVLEVNADKTKYMVMSRDRNGGRGHSVKIDNSSIERVEVFIYLGTTLTVKNFIQEEINSRLKLGNACYHSVQIFFCLPGYYAKT
jgi:hypothetical protein